MSNLIQFAEEFTRLIICHMRTSSPINDLSSDTIPLNKEQIVFTIHHVLEALNIKGFDSNNNNNNLLETFNDTSTIINPEISAMKIKRELDTQDICRSSEDIQSAFTNDDSSVSDISLPVIKTERQNSFNTLQKEMKFISQSNPAICINNIGRSDTFVREENQKNTKDQENVFEDVTNAENNLLEDLLQVALHEIRKSATDIMKKLNNLEQHFSHGLLNKATNVQQSFLTNGHSSPRRTPTINKTKMPTRRSNSILPPTPTSSKMLAIENGNISERRKSTGGIGTNGTSARKSGVSTKAGTSNQNSVSNLNLSASNKASSGSSVEFQPKFTKNPKYAHVQSTIPKAISQKKKMQE